MNIITECTFIPVLVASFTACNSLSYFGLNVTVKAQSMIRPEMRYKLDKIIYLQLKYLAA